MLLSVFSLPISLTLAAALPQTTGRVSVSTAGGEANADCLLADVSANGRFVAFASTADNLVPGDTNGFSDVFVRDLQTGTTSRISVSSGGVQGNLLSSSPAISADGRFIAFSSNSTNLVAGDTDGLNDIYVHDTQTGTTELVSQNSAGALSNGVCLSPCISADGRFVAFSTTANNLDPADTNGAADIYVFDRQSATLELVSQNSLGAIGNGDSTFPAMSANGNAITFMSEADNLVANDTNNVPDQFVRNRELGTTVRVNVSSAGDEDPLGLFSAGSISADGNVVAFSTRALNLVPGHTNGAVDVFVHELSTSTTSIVSISSLGTEADLHSEDPHLSADGRFVTFMSWATNLVPNDNNQSHDCFVHDRLSGTTERISLDENGNEVGDDCDWPTISGNGQRVVFVSASPDLVSGDTNGALDVFMRDRGVAAENNTIVLTGPSTANVSEQLDYYWFAGPPNGIFFFAYSLNDNGSMVAGHQFDIGPPNPIGTGFNTSVGNGHYQSLPIPLSAAGLTLYVEVACQDLSGQFYDSNMLSLTVL